MGLILLLGSSFLIMLNISQKDTNSFKDTEKQTSIHEQQYEQFSSLNVPLEKITVITGLENFILNHTDKIKNKNIGIVTNHTGIDNRGVPIWKRLQEIPGVTINSITLFSPEHGLFGSHADGEKISSHEEADTRIKVYSLYGETRKPTKEMLEGIDLILYDIQDIGARFYTYISTLGLLLESAGENHVPVIVLDRPNPITGTNIGGPILDLKYRSFVGYYPIPVQYGLTVGELANMMVGENWIVPKPILEVIPILGWKRDRWYDETTLIWTPTSPNIPDLTTAIVYPGTCFIEATNISEGRGTPHPFIWIGAPWIDEQILSQTMNKLHLPGVVFKPITFIPENIPGKAIHPKYENEQCQGIEINVFDRRLFESVNTGIAILTVINSIYSDEFFVKFDQMKRLFGSNIIINGLKNGFSYQEIIRLFKRDLEEFDQLRKNYLLYKN